MPEASPIWCAYGTREVLPSHSLAMRRQGWFGAAMAHNAELAYTGLTDIQQELEGRFVLRAGVGVKAEAAPRTTGRTNGKTHGKATTRASATTRRSATRGGTR